MTTLRHSNGQEQVPLFSQEDFPVKTLAKQELIHHVDLMENDLGCGRNISESFASYDHDSQSWKTYQPSFIEGLEGFSETFPQSGILRNGKLFQRQPLDAHIGVNVHGLWPTPTATDYFSPCHTDALRKLSGEKRPSGASIGMKLGQDLRVTRQYHSWKKPKEKLWLNPGFVEWLMGMPQQWTDLNHSETP